MQTSLFVASLRCGLDGLMVNHQHALICAKFEVYWYSIQLLVKPCALHIVQRILIVGAIWFQTSDARKLFQWQNTFVSCRFSLPFVIFIWIFGSGGGNWSFLGSCSKAWEKLCLQILLAEYYSLLYLLHTTPLAFIPTYTWANTVHIARVLFEDEKYTSYALDSTVPGQGLHAATVARVAIEL